MQTEDVVPIPGTRRRSYLEQSAAAAGVELSGAEPARIEADFPLEAAAGTRYPERGMRAVRR